MAEDNNETPEVETPAVETPEVETPEVQVAPDTEAQHTDPKPGDEKKSIGDLMAEAIDGAGPRKRLPEETPEAKATREAAEAEARAKEDTDAAAKGQVRGADGKFRAMTPEEKTAKEAAAAAVPAKKDNVNDPIPAGLKKETQERMQGLIDTVKSLSAVQKDHNELMGYINSTGASPAEFSEALNYMRAVHSRDPAQMERAYQMLQSELLGLSERMGKPIPEVNLLRNASNNDLVKEIQDGKLTVQRAHEIALWRSQQARQVSTATATRQQQDATAQRNAAVESGKSELNALEDTLLARDGEEVYRAKAEIVFAALESSFASIPPNQWKAAFSRAYESLKWTPTARQDPAAAAAAAAAARAPVRPTPMRPKAPAAGGTATAPKTALEAISAALDSM